MIPPDTRGSNSRPPEWKAITEAWDNVQAARVQHAAKIQELRAKGQFKRGQRWGQRLRTRVPRRRYSLAEAAAIFDLSERKVLNGGFDRLGDHVMLPDPVPSSSRVEYERLWDSLLAVLVRHDLAGIVHMGAPAEQYDTELSTIMPRLRDARNSGDATRVVREEFSFWFSPTLAGSPEQQQAAGTELWAVWQASGAETWWRRLACDRDE